MLSHPEEANAPTMIDNIAMINHLILKEINFFFVNFDDIQRLIVMNKKKIKAAIKNNLILEKRLIKKIWEKPKASNHKKSVYNPTTVDIEKSNTNIITIIVLSNQFFFIIASGYL